MWALHLRTAWIRPNSFGRIYDLPGHWMESAQLRFLRGLPLFCSFLFGGLIVPMFPNNGRLSYLDNLENDGAHHLEIDSASFQFYELVQVRVFAAKICRIGLGIDRTGIRVETEPICAGRSLADTNDAMNDAGASEHFVSFVFTVVCTVVRVLGGNRTLIAYPVSM
jgi:hypothetical protein